MVIPFIRSGIWVGLSSLFEPISDAFGMPLPGRQFNANSYDFGFQGQEKDDEIFNVTGSSYTAQFWQYDSRLGRRWNVDPVDKPWMSSYHAFSNNPILRVDPNGDTDYEVDKKGNVVKTIENEESDNVFIVDNDGNRIEGESISFEFGTITGVNNPKRGEKTLDLFNVQGDDEATQLFEFFAEKTTVEWSHARIGTPESGKNIVGSSNQDHSTGVGSYLRGSGYHLKEVYHNHPSGNPQTSNADESNAARYKAKSPKIKLATYVVGRGYYYYDENGWTEAAWDKYMEEMGIEPVIITPDNNEEENK